jgi:hypothetical protein
MAVFVDCHFFVSLFYLGFLHFLGSIEKGYAVRSLLGISSKLLELGTFRTNWQRGKIQSNLS